MATIPGRAIRMFASGEIDADDIVLLNALAAFADSDGYTYPAQGTLATCVRKDRSTVNRRLAKLSALLLIEAQDLPENHRARRKDGGQSVLSYRLIYDTPHRGESVAAQDNAPKKRKSVHRACASKDAQGPSSAPRRGASDSLTVPNRPTDAAESASGQSVVDGAMRQGIHIPVELAGLSASTQAQIRASLAKATQEQCQRFGDAVAAQAGKAANLSRWALSMAAKAAAGQLDPDDAAEAARARARVEAEAADRRRRELADEAARIEDDPVTPEMFSQLMPARLSAMSSQ